MSVLIIFIKLIAVFDLLVIAVYFGGDILSTMLNKLRRTPKQDDPFDFSLDTVTVSLSIDSIRQLYSGDAADFVKEKILPNVEKTMAVLTDQEQTAACLLLSALIGFLAAEAPMDEQSFPMVMELLNCMEGEKEDGCRDAVDILFEDKVSCHYCDSVGFTQIPGFLPENPLKNAEMAVEDDYGMIDGIINNGAKEPTVAELEQQARNGQPISLMDLAAAAHREEREKKKSVMEQLKSQPKAEHKKIAPKKSAEREI